MDVHGLWNAERPAMFFPLFLANGVTGVREMGGTTPDQGRWRDQVASGAVIGSRLVVPVPSVDGPPPGQALSRLLPPTTARKRVDSLKSAEADFLKVYTSVSRAAYFGIAVEAKNENFPFIGHVS